MKTITKKDLTKYAAEFVNEKAYIIGKIMDGVFSSLRDIITKTDDELRIEIRDFGVFEVKNTKPKLRARNPRTGETIYVPARKKVHFKPGKLLKEVLKKPLKEE